MITVRWVKEHPHNGARRAAGAAQAHNGEGAFGMKCSASATDHTKEVTVITGIITQLAAAL